MLCGSAIAKEPPQLLRCHCIAQSLALLVGLVAVTKVLPLILPWLISESCPAAAAHFPLGPFNRKKDKEEGLTVNLIKSRNFPNIIVR